MRPRATTGDGGVQVVVPAGAGPYRISAVTGDGATHVTVPSDSAATASIEARNGDGCITIGYADS